MQTLKVRILKKSFESGSNNNLHQLFNIVLEIYTIELKKPAWFKGRKIDTLTIRKKGQR